MAATLKQVKEFFGTGTDYLGRPHQPLQNKELMELKKQDPDVYDWLKEAVGEELAA